MSETLQDMKKRNHYILKGCWYVKQGNEIIPVFDGEAPAECWEECSPETAEHTTITGNDLAQQIFGEAPNDVVKYWKRIK